MEACYQTKKEAIMNKCRDLKVVNARTSSMMKSREVRDLSVKVEVPEARVSRKPPQTSHKKLKAKSTVDTLII